MLRYQVGADFRLFSKVPSSPVILRSCDSSNACACLLPHMWYVVGFEVAFCGRNFARAISVNHEGSTNIIFILHMRKLRVFSKTDIQMDYLWLCLISSNRLCIYLLKARTVPLLPGRYSAGSQ